MQQPPKHMSWPAGKIMQEGAAAHQLPYVLP
jgi:hypothetical protein